MKLIFCPTCEDVRKLQTTGLTTCECGDSYGQYLSDHYHAEIGGKAIPLGFLNSTLVEALKNQPKSGFGSNFTAFVIPKECPTINNLTK